jgi:catechol 2,3-dioxygenase-like lactoylglutathione lyase family enzyme
MRRLLLTGFFLSASIAPFVSAPVRAAESGAAPNGVRLTKYIIGVADLDKSYAFYHALGAELNGATALKPAAPLPDALLKLVDVPAGTKFRNAMLKIPGADFAVEMTEFSNMDLHAGRPRVFDPGAAVLILTVRDINAALTTAKKAGGEVVTTGSAPVNIGADNNTRAIFVKDPDSYYVELAQPSPLTATTAPAGSNVIAARFASVVPDAEKAAEFYRDQFGLEAKVGSWTSTENLLKLTALPSGQLRTSTVKVPGSALAWSFFEFKTSGAHPYKLRIPDPGAPAVGFEVHDLDAAASAMKAAGGSVITVGGPMKTPGGGVAFTRDPNGTLVELAQSAGKK